MYGGLADAAKRGISQGRSDANPGCTSTRRDLQASHRRRSPSSGWACRSPWQRATQARLRATHRSFPVLRLRTSGSDSSRRGVDWGKSVKAADNAVATQCSALPTRPCWTCLGGILCASPRSARQPRRLLKLCRSGKPGKSFTVLFGTNQWSEYLRHV
jgi:hypothetical protein